MYDPAQALVHQRVMETAAAGCLLQAQDRRNTTIAAEATAMLRTATGLILNTIAPGLGIRGTTTAGTIIAVQRTAARHHHTHPRGAAPKGQHVRTPVPVVVADVVETNL